MIGNTMIMNVKLRFGKTHPYLDIMKKVYIYLLRLKTFGFERKLTAQV